MLFKKINVQYFPVKAQTPTVLSPKTDGQWSANANPLFSWRYNGTDLQMQARIQIFNIPYNVIFIGASGEVLLKESWSGSETGYATWFKATAEENSAQILLEAVGCSKHADIIIHGNAQTYQPTDLDDFITKDGVYLWRIQTKGSIASDWSDWANDGLLRVDQGIPEILNVSSSTSYLNANTVSVISDLSVPNMKITRGDNLVNLGIGSQKGFYVYYDYRDNSLILRSYEDPNAPKRYYGMLSFHTLSMIAELENYKGYNDPKTTKFLYPHEVIDSIYSYTIDRSDMSEAVNYSENLTNKKLSVNVSDFLLNREDSVTARSVANAFDLSFKGFPVLGYTEGGNSVYGTISDFGFINTLKDPTFSYAAFPINSYLVPANKQFKFPDNTIVKFGTSGTLLEARYPAPYQDVFIIFDVNDDNNKKVLAFGQYSSWDDVIKISDDPTDVSEAFILNRGFNVEANRGTKPNIVQADLDSKYSVFSIANTSDTRCPYGSMKARLEATAYLETIGTTNKPVASPVVSPFIFFNLYPEENKDTAIKIRLRPKIAQNIENALSRNLVGEHLGFVEFYMYPETDCSICTGNLYKSTIRLDDVMIGNAKISPRDLDIFHSGSEKKFMVDVKTETCNYTVSNTVAPIGIESVSVFPVAENDFSDNSVIFVNDESFDLNDRTTVLTFSEDTTLSDRYIYNQENVVDSINAAIGISVLASDTGITGPVYTFEITDSTYISSFSGALTTVYGSNNVPSNSVWNSYAGNDIYVELFQNDETLVTQFSNRLKLKYFKKILVGDVVSYEVAFLPEDYVSGILVSLTDVVYYLKIKKTFSRINELYNDPRYVLALEKNVSPLSGSLPAGLTANIFLSIGNIEENGALVSKTYRIINIDNVSINNREFFYIYLFPHEWGKSYSDYLSLHSEPVLPEIYGFLNCYFYNSSTADTRKYNGSFQILLPPKYDYIPYFHPNAVAYLSDTGYAKDPVVPNIYDAIPYANGSDTAGWDSIYIQDSTGKTTDGIVKREFLLVNDYVKFFGNAASLGQYSPYFYNTRKWDALNSSVGPFIMNDHLFMNSFGAARGSYELGLGLSMYADGYSRDGRVFNKIDNGLYGVSQIDNGSGTSKIHLKSFSNILFKTKTGFVYNGSDFLSTDEFTSGISSSDAGYTFGWKSNSVLDSGDKTWIYNRLASSNYQAVLTYDDSAKGMFGENDVSERGWIASSGKYNPYGTHFISWTDDSSIHYEKMLRIIGENGDTGSSAIVMRGLSDNVTLPNSTTGNLTGDEFSLGNLFGNVYLQGGMLKVFFDTNESMSGISKYRYFVQSITTGVVGSSEFIGDENVVARVKDQIKMQVLNNASSGQASNLINYRSPVDIVTTYLTTDSVASTWRDAENVRDIVNDPGTGYGISRLFAEIPVKGSGYKLIHFQVKDKAGNESGICSVAVNVETAEEVSNIVAFANLFADNKESLEYTKLTKNDGTNDYFFTGNYLRIDSDRSRTLMLKNVSYLDSAEKFQDYDDSGNLLVGFSDNYGLNYNVFSPYTSYNPWDITVPLDIPCKSFSTDLRKIDPDWYFDPNHVRHYTLDTADEILANIAAEQNPGCSSATAITILGLMEESGVAKSNSMAKKIYENREELIGRMVVLGADLSKKFTILHIFESDSILPVARISGSATSTIDGDSARKVWVVIEDEDGVAAIILSRKFQYYQDITASYYDSYKEWTGWRQYVSDTDHSNSFIDWSLSNPADSFGNKTKFFGYQSESDVSVTNLEAINTALNVNDGIVPEIIGAPDELDLLRSTVYIAPSILTDKTSSIESQEGWVTRIYKIYDSDVANFDNLKHHNVAGIEVFDRMVFGREYLIKCKIDKKEQFSDGVTKRCVFIEPGTMSVIQYSQVSGVSVPSYVLVGNSRLDATMSNSSANSDAFGYEIVHVVADVETVVESGKLNYVSDNGLCAVLDLNATIEAGDWASGWGAVESVSGDYYIKVTIDPLQSVDEVTGSFYDFGWWASVGGILLPSGNDPIGTTVDPTEIAAKNLKFAIESAGSFYVDREGNYSFKILSDSDNVEFCVDYMRHISGTNVSGYFYNGISESYETKDVGGIITKIIYKKFYLTKGWHIGRLRYISSNSGYRNLCLMYRKPVWDVGGVESDNWIPFVGSRNQNKIFMKKGFRTVHCRIINKDGSEYPSAYSDSVNDERQYLRAIVGFDALDMNQSVAFKNYAVWATKNDSYPAFGQSYLAKKSFDRVYSAQIFEEAVGVYVSNVFDGGKDFRFWKSISWNPTTQTDPAGMDVEFYIRTAATEVELTSNVRKWNNIGSNAADGEIILEKLTNATGNNLVRFSQQASVISSSLGETIVNRFLQFKMVLKSRSYNQVPRVNDVTISYSKQNTVNFFTTTFDLKSNILRAILTYNGDTGLDVNGVALSDIQFGISTTEELSGTVSTNFDDYKIVPINEVFSIEDVGLEKNDKFRVGIRFISSADNVPTVDEFGLMWEAEKNPGSDTDQFIKNKDL